MHDDHHISLYEAFLKLGTYEEVKNFLIDLCTPQELKALNERWNVCQLLNDGKLSYRQISEITGSSTTTISRVSRFLNDEPHSGYRNLLNKLKKEKNDVKNDDGETIDNCRKFAM